MKIQRVCRICSKVSTITMSVEAYNNWKNGMHIQDAAPELSADDRELLISGICGVCFDTMFSQDDEDDGMED